MQYAMYTTQEDRVTHPSSSSIQINGNPEIMFVAVSGSFASSNYRLQMPPFLLKAH